MFAIAYLSLWLIQDQIRRVKCGEEKPECKKCSSTGRKCDDYVPQGEKALVSKKLPIRTEADSIPTSLCTSFSENPQESQIFDFLRHESAPKFAGNFASTFWDSTVFAVALTEPAVKHALVAVGALHMLYYRKDVFSQIGYYSEPAYTLALQQYNKAIKSLNKSLTDDGGNQQRVVLFTCVLFIFFEVIRGNEPAALVHFENGVNILQQSLGCESRGAVHITGPAGSTTDRVLWRIFTRIDLQATSYILRRISPIVVTPQPRPFFGNISEARSDLDDILGAMYSFDRNFARRYRYGSPEAIPSSVIFERRTLLSYLATWLQTLNILLQNRFSSVPFKDICGAIILKMEHQVAHISLNTCLLPHEGFTYDAFIPAFEQVVSLAESLQMAIPSRPADQPHFTIETSLIPSLFMVACKCREPVIRRRATKLLQSAGREGVWNGPIEAAVARKVIEIEEAEMVDGKIPETALVHITRVEANRREKEARVECRRAKNAEFTEWETLINIVRWE